MCPLIIRCYRWSLFCLLLVLVLIKPTCEGACQWDHCSRDFEVASARSDQEEGTDPWMLCRALQTHIICLRSLSKPCRGNLHYYSYVKGVTRVEDKTNCSHELETNLSTRQDNRTHKPLSTTVEPFLILPAFHGCSTINLTSDMKYCSVFGDLHIITGSGVFETCKIVGAYPLIENRYLAVQISSKNIRRSSYSVTVSSISRVTVIIKASECLEERKTYEASLGHLPQIFTDYTTESENVKVVERIPNQFVEIQIFHLRTVLFIRQIGQYLSVSISLPQSLMDTETMYQLCNAGCPESQLLQHKESMKQVPFRPLQQAQQWCTRSNLTGPFYAACLFDFALTGNFDAILMAKEAQQDWARLASIDMTRTPAWVNRWGSDFAIEYVRNGASLSLAFFTAVLFSIAMFLTA